VITRIVEKSKLITKTGVSFRNGFLPALVATDLWKSHYVIQTDYWLRFKTASSLFFCMFCLFITWKWCKYKTRKQVKSLNFISIILLFRAGCK